MTANLAADLTRYGPDAAPARCDLAAAQAYCRRLARAHYENFAVASCLLARELRQPFYNLYAYCRWADDLADETGDPAESQRLLEWWRRQLEDCYRGRATHPVFVALMETIEDHDLPPEPFLDLLAAFRQDQRQTRYETVADLLAYCRRSANPVGRLVLRLGRCANPENEALSDAICTGLQLANFCQDVARDFDRGRVYLPKESWRRFGYREEMFAQRVCDRPFRDLLAAEVARAERCLLEGRPLVRRVPRVLRVEVALFVLGGLEILRRIRQVNFDVWTKRPTVGKLARLRLLWNAWRGKVE